MKKIELTISNEFGLHARPASLISNMAAKYACKITLIKDDKEVDAKSIMNLLLLAAGKDSTIICVLDGEDEDEAGEALRDLIEVRKFDEE